MAKKSKPKVSKLIKKGGSGTKVGNLLRKVSKPVKAAAKAALATKPGLAATVSLAGAVNKRLNKAPVPNLVQTGPLSPELQKLATMQGQARDARRMKEAAMTADYVATGRSQFYDEPYAGSLPDQGNDMSDNLYVDGGKDIAGGFSEGAGGAPSNYAKNKRIGGVATPSMGGDSFDFEDEDPFGGSGGGDAPAGGSSPFAKNGVSNRSFTSPGGGLGSGGVGESQNTSGGNRKLSVAGTLIDDPVYKNLVRQYKADAQLDIDDDEIRDKVLGEYQGYINSVNAVSDDLLGRARERAKIREGSERALQARGGTLTSDFGSAAMEATRDVGDQDAREVQNDRLMKLNGVYAESRGAAETRIAQLRELKKSGADGYLAAMDKEESLLAEGLDAVADNFVSQGFTVEDLDEKGLKQIAKDWKVPKEIVYNKIIQKQREADQRALDASEQQAGIDKDIASSTKDGSTPTSADQFIYESNMLDLLPTQIRNSDKEREYYTAGIKALQDAGYSDSEAYNQFMGYTVENETPVSEAIKSLIPQSTLTKQKIKMMANELNKGNTIGAIQIIENDIMARAKGEVEDFISEPTVKTSTRLADEITKAIEGTKAGAPVGVVSGTMQKWLKKLKRADQAKVETAITNSVKEMRKRLAGSAVTPSEGIFLEPLIPDLNDKPDVFWNKVLALQSTPLLQLNSIRSIYGLPELDKSSLLNNQSRVTRYSTASSPARETVNSGGGSSGSIWDF